MQGYYEMKKRLMYYQNHSKSPNLREFWRRRVVFCNRKIGQIIASNIRLAIVLTILVVSTGCLENTARGLGGFVQGAGQLVTGVGKDITRAADGYGDK